jgi:hypothetical protein
MYKLDTATNPATPIFTPFPSMSSPQWVTSFDPDTLKYQFDPQDNSLIASYQIALFGTLTPVPEYQVLAAQSLAIWNIEININKPPTFDKYSFNVNNEMYAYHTWSVVAKFENDQEGDPPI